eukprot:1000535-Pyramimonas_sp.AAC.1
MHVQTGCACMSDVCPHACVYAQLQMQPDTHTKKRWARRDGQTEEFTPQMRDEVMSANNSFASEALR